MRAKALLSLAFAEDFALIDGATAPHPLARRLPAVALGARGKDRPPFRRGARAGRRQRRLLIAASASLARLVTGAERWERFVWTIAADPHLHQHPARGGAEWPGEDEADAEALAAAASLRSERQTFIPIGATGQAIFTIRIDSVPLARAVDRRRRGAPPA